LWPNAWIDLNARARTQHWQKVKVKVKVPGAVLPERFTRS
jgi:hypothetical protein